MQLLLIRHSITAGNLEHRYIGCRTDEPLCEAGIALAQQKSVEFRRSFPVPELVLVSPMQRCRQTAEILFPHMPQKTGVQGFTCHEKYAFCCCSNAESTAIIVPPCTTAAI